MFRYDPPGNLDDLAGRPCRDGFLRHWHQLIEQLIRSEIAALYDKDGRVGVPSPLFFTESDDAAQGAPIPVTWNAFPLSVARAYQNPSDGWVSLDTLREADDNAAPGRPPVKTKFRPQDEYCEWHWYADGPRGPRIVFTAEGPEYWVSLAAYDMARVVELYQELVSPDVREEDLLLDSALLFGDRVLPAGSYNPFNVWNTEKGVIHLTHPANTLGAEINLAARATILRVDAKGDRIADSRRLIASSGYGSVNRSSDPNIGFGVNVTAVPPGGTTVRSITLANPVGLYMDELANSRLTDKNDQPLSGWFKFVRGKAHHGLMAVLQPPEGDTRTLDDVYVDGEPLTSGAQVANLIQMVVYAATADLNAPMSPLLPPIFRACIAEGTDLSDLSKVNLTQRVRADTTCSVAGLNSKPPVKLDEAYPELFDTTGQLFAVASAGRRGMTRNG